MLNVTSKVNRQTNTHDLYKASSQRANALKIQFVTIPLVALISLHAAFDQSTKSL